MDIVLILVLLSAISIGGAFIVQLLMKSGATRPKAAPTLSKANQLVAYIQAANTARVFPVVSVQLNLRSGEVGLLQASAQLSEMHAQRSRVGGSVRVAKGVWISGSTYDTREERRIVDHGAFVVTNRRVAFVGQSRTAEVRYPDLLGVDLADDSATLIVHTSGRQKPIVAHFPEAAVASFLVRLFASGAVSENRLPEGAVLSASLNRDGNVEVRYTDDPDSAAGLLNPTHSVNDSFSSKDTSLVTVEMPPHARITAQNVIVKALDVPKSNPLCAFLSVDRWIVKPTEIKDQDGIVIETKPRQGVHKIEIENGIVKITAERWVFTSRGIEIGLDQDFGC